MIPTINKGDALLVYHALTDVISCVVAKSESGEYTLTMTYPVNGAYADDIVLRSRINCITGRASNGTQPFFISRIEQNISGILTVTAQHQTYDLAKYPIRAFAKASRTPEEAVTALFANSVKSPASGGLYPSAETSYTSKEFGFSSPTNWREAFFGRGGLLEVYGGVVVASGNSLKWYKNSSVGENKGSIRYGMNLTKFKRAYDISDMYSHAYVYWKYGDQIVQASDLVQLGDSEEFQGATVLDLSGEFDSTPTLAQLTQRAKELATQRELTSPEVNLDIAFVPLQLTDEYREMSWLKEVDLYDKVSIEVPMFGDTYARITQIQFDVLSENYKRITVGNIGRSLDRTIARLI